jgi:putative ABC transport system substrate-binding protein
MWRALVLRKESACNPTTGTPATVAVQRETRTIPIVFAGVADHVASGIATRLDRPSGNVTGFGNWEASLEATLGGKWLELLSEIAPGLKWAALMFNPETATASLYLPSLETTARLLKIALITAPVHGDVEIEAVIIALGREPGGGLVVIPDGFLIAHRARSYRRRPETTYRRSIRNLSIPETAACSHTHPTR